MKRAEVAVRYMMGKGMNSSKKAVMGIVGKIIREALIDASEVPPAIAEFYMQQLSAMIYWVGTGEVSGDIPLPEDFTFE